MKIDKMADLFLNSANFSQLMLFRPYVIVSTSALQVAVQHTLTYFDFKTWTHVYTIIEV